MMPAPLVEDGGDQRRARRAFRKVGRDYAVQNGERVGAGDVHHLQHGGHRTGRRGYAPRASRPADRSRRTAAAPSRSSNRPGRGRSRARDGATLQRVRSHRHSAATLHVEERFHAVVHRLQPRGVVDGRRVARQRGRVRAVAVGEDAFDLVVLPFLEQGGDVVDVEARVVGGGEQVAHVFGLEVDRLERRPSPPPRARPSLRCRPAAAASGGRAMRPSTTSRRTTPARRTC